MEYTCRRCGHTWKSRKKNPKACPGCKCYTWRELSENEKGFTQGLMYAAGLLARERHLALAEMVWRESNIPDDDAKYCAEYDVGALRKIIPNLPQGVDAND